MLANFIKENKYPFDQKRINYEISRKYISKYLHVNVIEIKLC